MAFLLQQRPPRSSFIWRSSHNALFGRLLILVDCDAQKNVIRRLPCICAVANKFARPFASGAKSAHNCAAKMDGPWIERRPFSTKTVDFCTASRPSAPAHVRTLVHRSHSPLSLSLRHSFSLLALTRAHAFTRTMAEVIDLTDERDAKRSRAEETYYLHRICCEDSHNASDLADGGIMMVAEQRALLVRPELDDEWRFVSSFRAEVYQLCADTCAAVAIRPIHITAYYHEAVATVVAVALPPLPSNVRMRELYDRWLAALAYVNTQPENEDDDEERRRPRLICLQPISSSCQARHAQ